MNLSDAFQFASERHAGHTKPGSTAPFLYHPLAVAALVIKHGGTEAQAKAALIHDTISDLTVTPEEISRRFGPEVQRLVFAFTDPPLPPGAGWEEARRGYLGKLAGLDEEELLPIACEELHEIGDLLLELRYRGVDGWKRFPAHATTVFWYFRELLALLYVKLAATRYQALIGELGAEVRGLKSLVLDGSSLPG